MTDNNVQSTSQFQAVLTSMSNDFEENRDRLEPLGINSIGKEEYIHNAFESEFIWRNVDFPQTAGFGLKTLSIQTAEAIDLNQMYITIAFQITKSGTVNTGLNLDTGNSDRNRLKQYRAAPATTDPELYLEDCQVLLKDEPLFAVDPLGLIDRIDFSLNDQDAPNYLDQLQWNHKQLVRYITGDKRGTLGSSKSSV